MDQDHPDVPRREVVLTWRPSTWLPFLYATVVYYLSLIAAHLPRYERITDDKSAERDAEKRAGTDGVGPGGETQTAKRVTECAPTTIVAATTAEDSSSLSFDCNCLTPHLSGGKTCSPSYVSTLSLPQRRRRPSLKKPSSQQQQRQTSNSPLSTSTSIPTASASSTPSTVSFRSPSPSSSESSTSTVSPTSTKSIIAVVPSGSHVLVGIPKLDWKTESIRIKRTRMSEWLDAEQRDVMRQFDEVIRNEEEEDEKTSKRKGILKNGSVRSTTSNTRRSALQETPVFVPPPPPPDNMLLPIVAQLDKQKATDEFGFNLHAEKGKGHFIGTVDQGGIGERAGLEAGQRIVGVNGQLIYPQTGHKEVVSLIKQFPLSTTLLVASVDVDKWHRDHNVSYSFDNVVHAHATPVVHAEVLAPKSNGYEAPALNPHSIQVNEEREVSKLTTTTKTEVISTNTASYQYKETTTAYDAYAAPPAANSDDLMAQVFGRVDLPPVGNQVTIHSHTEELPAEDASSVSSLTSSHRESAVDVPITHQYVPSYVSQSHQQEDRHSQTHQNHHQHHQQHQQQPSPLSNGSSHGYAASSTSGYDDDDIYHLSAKEARERLRNKNRKHHLHEMSLNEKYQLVSNM
ncbi:unnamed protein product [Caenorhabditis sp. 36 PRJEB53466]|nr:unnamed protein product [Caenorhabditis sp. 36 PRJEB53466]